MGDIWKSILGGREEFKPLIDTATVRILQTLVPKFSSDDRRQIESLMDEGKIFPKIIHSNDRSTLLDRLLIIPGRILSFHTLNYDGRYLQSCSELLRELLPPFKRGSTNTVRGEIFRASRATDTAQVDKQHTFKCRTAVEGYCQLYLFVMRYGAAPRKLKGKVSMQGLDRSRLACFAISLGFNTEEIQALCIEADSANEEAAFFMDDNTQFTDPQFTTNSAPLRKAQRCG